jgi:hypothetical protein
VRYSSRINNSSGRSCALLYFTPQDLQSIISVVLPSGQKLTLGLLSTITLEAVPFCTCSPFPALLPFLKCTLEIVFCEDVQHRLRFCLNRLNCVKMAASQSYLQSEKQRKVVFGQKFPGEKGSVRQCVVMMQQPVLLSPKFEAKSSHIFMQSP